MARGAEQDDEALARALQEQYEREFRNSRQNRRQQPGGSNNTSAAPVVRGHPVTSSATGGASSRGASASRRERSSSRAADNNTSQRSSSQTNPGSPSSSRPQSRLQQSPPLPSRRQMIESDEEYARRLEQSFREQDRSSRTTSASRHQPSSNRSSSVRPSAPLESETNRTGNSRRAQSSSGGATDSDADYARRLARAMQDEELATSQPSRPSTAEPVQHQRSTNTFFPRALEEADEEFARRLQADIQQEEAVFTSSSSSPGRRSKGGMSATPATSRTSSEISALSDEEMARRVEQEIRDEEVARQLAAVENDRAAFAQTQQDLERSRRCTWRRCISYTLPVLFIGAATAGIVYYFTRPNNFPVIFPTPEDFRNEDPFNSMRPSQADKWRNNGEGLDLQIVNALDSSWHSFFYIAVDDWDTGRPDALTLTTSSQQTDYSCDPINGVMKVCNGDYGATRWRGINKILLTGGYIFASSARMNEYYLSAASAPQKQYTMCHEIGHGFGLPHTDESFTNRDLGNCMDYTNNPAANMQPDETNYVFLKQLYGKVPGSPQDDDVGQAVSANAATPGGRKLGKDSSSVAVPDWVMEKWQSLEDELAQHSHGSERRAGWRLLHETKGMEAHEIDLGGGYAIQVHKLTT